MILIHRLRIKFVFWLVDERVSIQIPLKCQWVIVQTRQERSLMQSRHVTLQLPGMPRLEGQTEKNHSLLAD